jgi:hypothetical protein
VQSYWYEIFRLVDDGQHGNHRNALSVLVCRQTGKKNVNESFVGPGLRDSHIRNSRAVASWRTIIDRYIAGENVPLTELRKAWLGEPKIDWSQVKSWQDLQSYFPLRNDNYFRIISDDILKKLKKTLLIIGTGHLFGPKGRGAVKAKIDAAYPNELAVVSPFVGCVEAEGNARIAAQTKDWPAPSVVGPVMGTRLRAIAATELQLQCRRPARYVGKF